MKKLIVITGPTASGKTDVSIQLARHFNSEIISADSRQFYRRMDIGTAKPGIDELKFVPHHFIDIIDVTEKYNIGKFETEALERIESLFKKHDILFLTGGSGLYIDALCHGIDELPETSPEIRNDLIELFNAEGITALQKKLEEADPEYYSDVDLNNPHRLIRALEVSIISGKKYSTLRGKKIKERDFTIKKIGLLLDRQILYDRIDDRVDKMIKNGLIEEVESLLPYRAENAMQTVGYKEIIEYLDKKITLENAIRLIKQHTRNYAKRQMTWFRRDQEIHWFDPSETTNMISYIEG